MATVKVIDIIKRVEDILQDTNVRWPRLELQSWLNEAYLSVVSIRPDANTQTGTLTCVTGTRQSLLTGFPSALRLIDVVRNMAGASQKKSVRQVSRNILDDQRPGWHAETPTLNIQHFMFDPRLPKEFLVYPPASTSAQLEIVYSAPPLAHTLLETALDPTSGDTTVINMDDIYSGPLTDWVLYRAYSKDAEYGANDARAASHYTAFTQALVAKTAVDDRANPQVPGRVT